MSAHDWTPITADDPLPGDPIDTKGLGLSYTAVAQEISDTVTQLRRIGSDTSQHWAGKAGEKFRSSAGDLADRVDKAHARYAAAGTALTTFAEQMGNHQADAARAVEAARDAQSTMTANPQPAPAKPGDPAPPPQTDQQKADAAASKSRHDTANADFETAKTNFYKAVAAYTTDGDTAASSIRTAIKHDGLKDSWWYRHYEGIKKALEILGAILLVIIIIALVVSLPFLAGLGGLLGAIVSALSAAAEVSAGALEVAGAVLAAASLINDIAGKKMGEEDGWSDIIWDVAGVATFGTSKLVLAPRLEAASKAAKALADSNAKEQAIEDSITSQRAAGKIPSLAQAIDSGQAAVKNLDEVAEALAKQLPASNPLALALRDSESVEKIQQTLAYAALDPSVAPQLTAAARAALANGTIANINDVHEGIKQVGSRIAGEDNPDHDATVKITAPVP